MKRGETLQLRLEMLRLRGALERAELAAALAQVRAGVSPLASPLAGVLGAASALQGGWVGALAGRPAWAASTALLLLRVARRHPRLLTAVVAGGALAWLAGRRRAGRQAASEVRTRDTCCS